MSRALDGTNPVAYLGVRPLTPPNMIIPGVRPTSAPRDPTQNDYQYNLGDFWLNTSNEDLWYLAALGSHLVSGVNTRFATWLLISTGIGEVKTLTGNTGGPVGPDVNGNINTIGSTASGIVVNGNPGTNTLTWTSSGGGHFGETLTGDTGGAVQFDSSGNINVIADNAANNSGSSVLIVGNPGTHTLTLNVTDASNNTLVGDAAGNLTLTGANNTGLGASVLEDITTASFNTGVGSGGTLFHVTTGDSNTGFGYQVLDEITTGTLNIGLGAGSGNAYTSSESSNIMIGNAGVVSESNVIRLGTDGSGAGQQSLTYMSGDVHFPHNIILDASTASAATNPIINWSSSNNRISFIYNSVFIGQNAGNSTLNPGALFNIGIGPSALNSVTTGTSNTAVGNGSLGALTTGTANSMYGYTSGEDITTGSENNGFGDGAFFNLTTGSNNTGIGTDTLGQLLTGSDNTALGNDAGNLYTGAESSNVVIKNQGVVGESNTIRIGTNGGGAGQQNTCYIAGIAGVTTTVNDAVPVLISASTSQLGTVSSSIRFKENVKDMGHESDAIFKLRPVTFNYKKDENKNKQFGLIAEEVSEALPKIVVYDKEGNAETVKYQELPILLLNELQKQKKTIDALSRTVLHLENLLQDKNFQH